jgi:hypothetical protein
MRKDLTRSTRADSPIIRELSKAFFRLSPDVKGALSLYLAEGESLSEVAECLQTSLLGAKSFIEAGLGEIKEDLRRSGFLPPKDTELGRLLRRIPVPPPSPDFLKRLLSLPERKARPE